MSREPSMSHVIHKMLFGMGDFKEPLEATASIIEDYLVQQLDIILTKAQAINQECDTIGIRNILFLMRNNPVRLQRLFNYFELKSKRSEYTSGINTSYSDKEFEADLKLYITGGNKKNVNSSTIQQCIEFFKELDLNYHYEYIDNIKHERLLKNNELSQQHSAEDYLLFGYSRAVSFDSNKYKSEFTEWMTVKLKNNPGVSMLTPSANEVLQYLAKEIVCQIVEYALLLRADGKSQKITNYDLMTNRNTIGKPKSLTCPLLPDEINEVMRRFNYMHQKPFHDCSACIVF